MSCAYTSFQNFNSLSYHLHSPHLVIVPFLSAPPILILCFRKLILQPTLLTLRADSFVATSNVLQTCFVLVHYFGTTMLLMMSLATNKTSHNPLQLADASNLCLQENQQEWHNCYNDRRMFAAFNLNTRIRMPC